MGLVRLALGNVYGVVVFALFLMVLGAVALVSIPVDILPAFKVPAVQVLTYYNGMPARSIERMRFIRRRDKMSADPSAGGVAPPTIDVLPPWGTSGTPVRPAIVTISATSSFEDG